MYVTQVEVAGLGGLPKAELPMDRFMRLDGPPRALTALADAVTLAFSIWDADVFRALLLRWGCGNPVIEGKTHPEAAQWEHGPGLRALLDPQGDGLLTVALRIQLDPPQYGRLRKEAARDPRLVDALSDGAMLTLRVGARFSPAFDALALDQIGFVVGDVAFAVAGSDRPAWMTPFLAGLTGRYVRGPIPPARWAVAAASYRREEQLALRRALRTLSSAPFALGEALVTPDGPAFLVEDAVVALPLLGEDVGRRVGTVGAVHLSGADVMLLEYPPSGLDEWLASQAESDGSPLEQVLLLGVPGGVRVG